MNDDRTWLASVLFLDIVGYSKKPVDQQLAVKRHFQQLVADHTACLDLENTIRLDTGDGMALCYLGDPEKIYPIARHLRDSFAVSQEDQAVYAVRLGLNLGPIKVIQDLNDGRNCVGAGINDAERVMSFAAANQLLVSKSYFDMVCKMSQDYAEQLQHLGARADKHDQQHEVYELAVDVIRIANNASSESRQGNAAQLDPTVVAKIQVEYAKYVGTREAEQAVAECARCASSINGLCDQLKTRLNEDDRYSFNEYLKYYGYAGY